MPVDEKMPRHRIGRGRAGILGAVSVVARSKRQGNYSRSLTPTPPLPFQGEGAAIPLSVPGGEELAAE